jgi:hypothetical protein
MVLKRIWLKQWLSEQQKRPTSQPVFFYSLPYEYKFTSQK